MNNIKKFICIQITIDFSGCRGYKRTETLLEREDDVLEKVRDFPSEASGVEKFSYLCGDCSYIWTIGLWEEGVIGSHNLYWKG